jgi:hypothetical protein
MIPTELQEFVSDGESRVRSDVEQLNARLAAHRKAGEDFVNQDYDELFTVVLEACAYKGRGALDYDGCLKALFPFLPRFSSQQTMERWGPLLQQIAGRSDVNKRTIRNEILSGVTPQISEEPAALTPSTSGEGAGKPEREPNQHIYKFDSVPAVGSMTDQLEFEGMTRAWILERARKEIRVRAEWDVWFVRSALLQRRRLTADYVETLTADDEFWASEIAELFANSLAEPPRPEAIGWVSAALLNSRLRYMRPRLYLRAPESPVIQAIATRSDISAAETSWVEEIGYPFVRCLRLIRDELNRGRNLAPRKGMLSDLEAYLQQVLDRLGVRPDDMSEDRQLAFDPSQHITAVPLEIGTPVRLLHAGLVDRQSGRRVFKAVVSPLESGQGSDSVSPDYVGDHHQEGKTSE